MLYHSRGCTGHQVTLAYWFASFESIPEGLRGAEVSGPSRKLRSYLEIHAWSRLSNCVRPESRRQEKTGKMRWIH